MKSPKKPKKTNEEKALESRQRIALNKEIEEEEDRLKSLSRVKLGFRSLLSGAATTRNAAATATAAKGTSQSNTRSMFGTNTGSNGLAKRK